LKYFVIANPTSRRGKSAQQIPVVEGMLRRYALDFDLVLTKKPYHATKLATQAARDGYDAVIAVGGDGTINEVVNGLMHARKKGAAEPALGLIGVGTGNDLIFGLGHQLEIDAACKAIANDKRRKIDIGQIITDDIPEGRYFANGVGIGFDAAGGVLAEKINWPHGFLAYLIAALQNIFLYYKAPILEIIFEKERIEMPILLISVMNGRRVGGGFLTAPEALPDDGLFDLCIAKEVSRPRMLSLLPRFLQGSQIHQPEIQMKRAQKITVNALHGLMPIHTDGEIISTASKEVMIEIIPQALEIIGGVK
jgi:YegS/Rv2252/BmrU family lipid kinase